MSLEERLKYFDENFHLIAAYHLAAGNKQYIGDKNLGCRFCGKKEPDVTFSNEAHAIPEFLGNKQLILRNECDDCNTHVSNHLENSLDKFTKPFRLVAQIKGKKKVPAYKTKDQKSRFEFFNDVGVKITAIEDSNFVSLDQENKSLHMHFHIEPYVPMAVYKCLVKMALSVIEDKELENFKNTIAWIFQENNEQSICSPLILLRALIPGPRPNKLLTAIVLKRKEESNQGTFCQFVLCFGNLSYQIIIPSDIDINENKEKVSLVRFPLPFELESAWPYGELVYDTEDLTSNQTVKDRVIPITFSFSEIKSQKL